jgi:hypothetical protein
MPYYQTRHDYAYIPTGHQLRIKDLANHEYFGDDFVDGKCTAAVLKTATGKLRVVWSFGDWADYGHRAGDLLTFQHTQHQRCTELTYIGHLSRENLPFLPPEALDVRAAHWTLK